MWIVIVLIGILVGLLALSIWLWIRIKAMSRDNNLLRDTATGMVNVGAGDLLTVQNNTEGTIVGSRNRILVRTPYGRIVTGILSPIDQHNCNACWAIATCQTVSDRMHLKGKIEGDQLNYYAYHDIITAKTPLADGCNSGAYLETGLDMFVEYGAPLMSETKDRHFDDRSIPSDHMADTYKVKRWRHLTRKNAYGNINMSATIAAMRRELDTNGPIVGVINLYDSFNYFEGPGVYAPDRREKTDESMAHMISVVGYDDRDKTWIIRNSYGTSFGYHGYVKINIGDRRLGLEEYVYAPDL